MATIVKKIVFLWENFGPQHHDRLNAAAAYYGLSATVVGIELSEKSGSYIWAHETNSNIEHHVVCRDEPHFFHRSLMSQFLLLVPLAVRQGPAVFMLSHYERPIIFLLACILRLLGRRVVIMNDSKFDDYDRSIIREILKSLMYRPYHGALVASHRSASYLHFLGITREHIRLNYDNLSRDRVRSLVTQSPQHPPCDFRERKFIVVARLIEKKNLFRTLDAYALYRKRVDQARNLVIVGYGPLEASLKAHARSLDIADSIEFTGALPAEAVAQHIYASVALLLLSTEEQFGQVVLEAQALSIPIVVSQAVGAVDCFVRNNMNGLIVDPYDTDEIAKAMTDISENQVFWQKLSDAAEQFSEKGDSKHFAASLDDLIRNIK